MVESSILYKGDNMREYKFNGVVINGLTLIIEGQELTCSENGYQITYGGEPVPSPKYFLSNLEDAAIASLEIVSSADANAALSHSSWFNNQLLTKEKYRAKSAILSKASIVVELLDAQLVSFEQANVFDSLTKVYKLLAQKIAGVDSKTKEQRTVNQVNLYITYLLGYKSLTTELKTSVIAEILEGLFMHQCSPTSKGGILESTLESKCSKPIGEIVGKYVITNFQLKAEMKRTIMAIDLVDVYAERGIEFTHVILEVLKYFKFLNIFVPYQKTSYEVHPVLSILELDPIKDKHIVKFLSKDFTSTNLIEFRELISEQRVSMYSGTPAKKEPTEQPSRVLAILDSMRSAKFKLGDRLTDHNHPIGKAMLNLLRGGLEHKSQLDELDRYLESAKGKTLFQRAKLTKDNGRVNTTHSTTAGKAKLYESATKCLITDEGATLYRAAIAKLEAKAEPSRKELMELVHYKDALYCYNNNIPSGHYFSKDFTGSGPLMQAIATGDWERVLFSVSYDGSTAHDPYKEILKEIYTLVPYAELSIKVATGYGPLSEQETDGILRQWVKSLMQPTMYGAGKETAIRKGHEDSKHFDLDYEVFMKAFEKALPGTFRVLKYLREFSSALAKHIAKNPRDPRFRTLMYRNPYGTQCRITSFRKVVENGESVSYKHTFSLGRRRDIEVPMAIIDPEALGASLVAAFSHQMDSSVMMMIHELVRESKLSLGVANVDSLLSTHDDFLDHVNFASLIDEAGAKALQFHWELEDPIGLFINQICQQTGFKYKPFKYITDKSQEIDWSKVKPFG